MKLETLIPDVVRHATECQPAECCGLAIIVAGKLRYWPCRNDAAAGHFLINPEDYAAGADRGELVAICHSHVYLPPLPSDADRAGCERSGLPWLIVNWPVGTHHVIEPSGWRAPLVGRQFVHGVMDCLTLIQDYYRETLGIQLKDYERAGEWWLAGKNHYLHRYRDCGFDLVGASDHQDLRPHDVLLMQVGSPVPNHAAIYLGDNLILQHCQGRLSSRDVFGGYWRKVTTHVLRHGSLL